MRGSFKAVLLFLAIVVLSACGGGGGGSKPKTIPTTNGNAITQGSTVTVNGVPTVSSSGGLPAPSPDTQPNKPTVSVGNTPISAQPGQTTAVSAAVTSSSPIAFICVTFGSDSKLCTIASSQRSSSVDATPAPKALEPQILELRVTPPSNLATSGPQFCLRFNITDTNGLVSDVGQVCFNSVAMLPPVQDDQASASDLPGVLAASQWLGSCFSEPGTSMSVRSRLSFGLPNTYSDSNQLFTTRNDCTGPSELRQVSGTYAIGALQPTPQRQTQRVFDFFPSASSSDLRPCFNVLRIANNQLLLGIPLTFQIAGAPDRPGSCVSAGNRPATVIASLPYQRDAINLAPTASASASPQNPAPDVSVSLNGSGSSDSDGTIASFRWMQTSGQTVSLTGANTANASFMAPNVQQNTSLGFMLTVTDNDGASATASVLVTVTPPAPVNRAPTARAEANPTSTTPGVTVSLNGSASSDGDGNIASYAWVKTAGPEVTLNGANTSVANFVSPNVAQATTLTFALTVTDNGGASATEQVSVTVTPPNFTVSAGASQTVTSGDVVTLGGSINPAQQSLSADWLQTSGLPVTLSSNTALRPTFTAPTVSTPTTLAFRLMVFSGGRTEMATTMVTVNPRVQNQLPNATVCSQPSPAQAGQFVTLDGRCSVDPDGTISASRWEQIPGGPTVVLQNANTATAMFTAPTVDQTTTLSFRLVVTDNSGATDTETIAVTINAPAQNQRPNAVVCTQPPPAQPGNVVVLDGSCSTDPDGTIASHQWDQIADAAPVVALQNANTSRASFAAPAVSQSTMFNFRLTVTDNSAAPDFATASVTVNPMTPTAVSAGPEASAISAAPGDTIILMGSAIPSNTAIRWRVNGGEPIALQDERTLMPSFTVPQLPAAGTFLTFTIESVVNPSISDTIVTYLGTAQPGAAAVNIKFGRVNNTTANIDFRLREPSGTVIFMGAPGPSPNGGTLRFQTGQNPLGTIAYANDPPAGDYCFSARYVEGQGATTAFINVQRRRTDSGAVAIDFSLPAVGFRQLVVATVSGNSVSLSRIPPEGPIPSSCTGL